MKLSAGNSPKWKSMVKAFVVGTIFVIVLPWPIRAAAAIDVPEFFKPFLLEHQLAGLLIFNFATLLPAWALVAAPAGYLIAKWIPGRPVLFGFIALVPAVALFLSPLLVWGLAFFRMALVLGNLPGILGMLLLPLFAALFSRSMRASDSAAT